MCSRLPKSFVSEMLPTFDVGIPVLLQRIRIKLFEALSVFVECTRVYVKHLDDSENELDELESYHRVFARDDTALTCFGLDFVNSNLFMLLLFFAKIHESAGDKLSSRRILFEMGKRLHEAHLLAKVTDHQFREPRILSTLSL